MLRLQTIIWIWIESKNSPRGSIYNQLYLRSNLSVFIRTLVSFVVGIKFSTCDLRLRASIVGEDNHALFLRDE